MTNYTKTMREALESMYISEDNVGILRDIVKRKSAMPLKFADGKMKVDLFTASAVTQVLDKVNPANKTKLTKMINTGKKGSFIKIAQVVMKSENDPEVEEENEGFASDAQRRAAFASGYKEKGKKKKEELDKDDEKSVDGVVKQLKKSVKAHQGQVKSLTKDLKDEVELDENKLLDALKKKLSDEGGAAGFKDLEDTAKKMDVDLTPDMLKKMSGIKQHRDGDYILEEAELDEAKNYEIKNGKIHISKANFRKVHKDYKNTTKGKERMMALDPKSGATTSYEVVFEEVEESYEYGTDEYAKHTRDVTPGQGKEVDEASARRDAMRDMGKRGKDSADVDDYKATADDRKAADKNIIMQLRKATNLGGKFEVEFKDKKKQKVSPAIAMAFIKKYEKMKPTDKAKLQDKGSKSYRDLLKSLKEEDTSLLSRIHKKLKEIKNG